MPNSTLCDVLESEFVNRDRQLVLAGYADEYKKVLSDADLRAVGVLKADQLSYLTLREQHINALRDVESLQHLAPNDARRRAAQDLCAQMEKPRIERLMKILRTIEQAALKSTLCDVLESEFVNLNRHQDLAEDTGLYRRALSDADDSLKAIGALTAGQPSYLDLREQHLGACRGVELLRNLPATDDRRAAAQDLCDEMDRPRIERLMKILRTRKRAALCFSGGGIRSATFNLGVLQGLSHHCLLTQIDYLSTVSGGGYIGSWLSAWRTRDSFAKIEESLRDPPARKLDGEIDQVEHLRSYSNYLSPELGILSADSWTLAATVIRNMFLNWMILVPMLAAVLLIPKFAVAMTLALPQNRLLLMPLLPLGSAAAVIAVAKIGHRLPSMGNLPCTERDYLINILVPLSISAIFLNTFWVGWIRSGRELSLLQYCSFGAALHLAGWLSMSDGRRTFAHQRRAKANYLRAFGQGAMALGTARNGGFLLGAVVAGAAGGWCAWGLAGLDSLDPCRHPVRIVCIGFPAVMAIYFFATALFIGLASKTTNDEDREWWARSGGWILIVSSAWALASLLVIGGPILIQWVGAKIAAAGGLAGLASGAFGSLLGKSAESGADKKDAEKKGGGKDASSLFSSQWFLKLALRLTPLIFLLVLLLAISQLAQLILADGLVAAIAALPPPIAVLVLAALAAGLAWVMGHYVNVNTFSLHAMYRSRLIRAYLGASNPKRKPSLFTGFDPNDNICMRDLAPGKPFHVINMALNLVHGKRLAWQERKAETFTATRLHSGSARIGYQKTETYGDKPGPRVRPGEHMGITLGTAMAISGAAASPNMGYHSSPLLSFLMTFFNARLGWWLANPGYPGEGLWGERGPKSALKSLIYEALGQTDDENPWVYLSDGGHFENLGVYEMVLRRCETIVVVDAGADPEYQFEDLANAIRKIRVDLGVTIHFDKPLDMQKGIAEKNLHCAIGHIGYGCIDGPGAAEGTLIYIKPVLEPKLSIDLDQYYSVNPDFPQQSTANQFFGEAQFESYRRLGLETIDTICEKTHPRQTMTLADLVRAATRHSGDKESRTAC